MRFWQGSFKPIFTQTTDREVITPAVKYGKFQHLTKRWSEVPAAASRNQCFRPDVLRSLPSERQHQMEAQLDEVLALFALFFSTFNP